MQRAHEIRAAGSWHEAAADRVVLDFEARHRRRVTLTCTSGDRLLLDLPEVPALKDGDALVLDDGRLVEVVAASEALLEISADSPEALTRLAWHLGNRHLATEIAGGLLHVREDHVIEDMLRQLGARVTHVQRPFQPEGGAYGHGRTHSHDHGESHSHDH